MEQPMTPPPTITTRACLGRSAMASGSHAGVVGIESGRGKDACAAGLTLQHDVKDAAGRGELRFHAGEREALAHPMTVSTRGRHADAAAAGEYRLAAARIGVLGLDFRIDDLERPRARPESQPCRRSQLFFTAKKRGISASIMVSSLVSSLDQAL